MLRSTLRTIFTLTAIATALMPGSYADESRTDSVQANTPAGSVSTSVHTHKDDLGSSSTSVDAHRNTLGEQSSTKIREQSGPIGSSSSVKSDSVRANVDGSVSTSQHKERHVNTPLGSAHSTSNTSTNTSGDRSTSVHHEIEATTR